MNALFKEIFKMGGKMKARKPRRMVKEGVAGVLCSPALSDLSSDVYDVYCILKKKNCFCMVIHLHTKS